MKLFAAISKILPVVLLCLSFSAFADVATPQVKINSFYMVGGNVELGEVCGVVTNNENTSFKLTVTADPKHNPGYYHTFTGADGNFCELVHTYTGRVQVELMGAKDVPAAEAQISGHQR